MRISPIIESISRIFTWFMSLTAIFSLNLLLKRIMKGRGLSGGAAASSRRIINISVVETEKKKDSNGLYTVLPS